MIMPKCVGGAESLVNLVDVSRRYVRTRCFVEVIQRELLFG